MSTIFSSLLLRVERREITFPDGAVSPWEICTYPEGVTAVAAIGFSDADRDILMIRNYRPSLGRWMLEVAGGLPAAGEDLEQAAKREFEEETGYLAKRVERGPLLYSLPGIGRFPIQCFVVDPGPQLTQRLDANERINTIRTAATPDDLVRLLTDVVEPVSLCLLNHVIERKRLRRGESWDNGH